MKGYLVTNHYLTSGKYMEMNALIAESAERAGIELLLKTNRELLSSLAAGGVCDFEKPDFVLFWDKDVTLCRMLESLGVRVFNSSAAIAACDNKGMTHAVLNKIVPMPKTFVAPLSFKNEDLSDFVKRVAKELGLPMIIKESYGSFGFQVYKVEHVYDAVELANRISPNQMIFQEYVESSKGRDVRINVVGDKVVAAMERFNDNDFRANITNGGSMKPYKPTKKECEIAVKAVKALGLDFGGVDLLFGPDGPLLCEVNSNAHIKNILDCTGINVADEIFSYVKGELR